MTEFVAEAISKCTIHKRFLLFGFATCALATLASRPMIRHSICNGTLLSVRSAVRSTRNTLAAKRLFGRNLMLVSNRCVKVTLWSSGDWTDLVAVYVISSISQPNLYGVSEQSLYRALAQRARPRALRRSDRGTPRVLPQDKLEYYCELIAAIKVRTSNKKGRHLSTGEAIRLIEEFGVETPDGLIKAQKSMFKTTTVNRYLRQWGYDHETLRRQPAAVRFQAEHSNDCWQFDMSPSDLKQIKKPSWVRDDGTPPTLMLFSTVDDRSGVAYQEYRCVYGEDAGAALRFLFNAMTPKPADHAPFQGIPRMIYMDNGPVSRSHVFHQVMRYLDVEVRTHMPQD